MHANTPAPDMSPQIGVVLLPVAGAPATDGRARASVLAQAGRVPGGVACVAPGPTAESALADDRMAALANDGVQMLHSELVCFLADDDEAGPDRLAHLVQLAADQMPGRFSYTADIDTAISTRRGDSLYRVVLKLSPDAVFRCGFAGDKVAPLAAVMPRSLLRSVGGFVVSRTVCSVLVAGADGADAAALVSTLGSVAEVLGPLADAEVVVGIPGAAADDSVLSGTTIPVRYVDPALLRASARGRAVLELQAGELVTAPAVATALAPLFS